MKAQLLYKFWLFEQEEKRKGTNDTLLIPGQPFGHQKAMQY